MEVLLTLLRVLWYVVEKEPLFYPDIHYYPLKERIWTLRLEMQSHLETEWNIQQSVHRKRMINTNDCCHIKGQRNVLFFGRQFIESYIVSLIFSSLLLVWVTVLSKSLWLLLCRETHILCNWLDESLNYIRGKREVSLCNKRTFNAFCQREYTRTEGSKEQTSLLVIPALKGSSKSYWQTSEVTPSGNPPSDNF